MRRRRSFSPVPTSESAGFRFPPEETTAIRGAEIDADGRLLRLWCLMGAGELLVEAEETAQRVNIGVRIGINPARPRPRQPAPSSPSRSRTLPGRRWTQVQLARPLDSRSVYDSGGGDPTARSAARPRLVGVLVITDPAGVPQRPYLASGRLALSAG